ncbi:MAG: hypothetical protein M0R77_07810 [Gammaproteobacteria bacterium]|nr:hypothetical protein [Gammaproteobacteria bacterium]
MRTRIKVVEKTDFYGNVSAEYIPQRQHWTDWPCWVVTDVFSERGPFFTLESAQQEIDWFLESQKRMKAESKKRTVVEVSYIKYP